MTKQCVQKLAAELVGTFSLALAVGLSIIAGGDSPVVTPVVAGLTLGLFVYTIGSISGSHINPAVTIALAVAKKIETKCAVGYLVAQFVGGYLASLVLAAHGGTGVSAGGEGILIAEAAGTFFLLFGIAAVVCGKVQDAASGLTIGGSLLLGVLVAAGLGSNGVLNPAVAVGIGSVSPAYFAGPVVGAIVAMLVYKFVACDGNCGTGKKK